tara:strand:+ start:963 stop:1433 length:471 start_codon:yes stop_codon:yes gene_type:complete
MPVTGFTFTKIQADRKGGKVTKELDIKPNITIKNVEEDKEQSQGEDKVLKVDFLLDVNYEPDVAAIIIGASVSYTDKAKIIDDVLKKQNEDKKVDDKIINETLGIFQINAHIKVLELTRQMSVPPHIRLPLMQLKKELDLNEIRKEKPKEEPKPSS